MFPAAVGHDPPDRLRPGRLRLALGAAGLHDQEQAAFRRKERGTDRHLPAHAARDQPDPGTRVRAQRQPQRGLLQIPPRLRHPLRRTQPGTRPPYRRPGTGSASAATGSPGSIRPAAPASKPGAARLGPLGTSPQFPRTLLPDLHFLLRLLRGLLRLQPAGEQPEDLPRFAPATPRNPGQQLRNPRADRATAAGAARTNPARDPRVCQDDQFPGRPLPGARRRLAGEKILHPLGDRRPSKTPRRKTARSSPWRNSTSITRIIRGPTNTPSRPSRTPFAATCSSGSCG